MEESHVERKRKLPFDSGYTVGILLFLVICLLGAVGYFVLRDNGIDLFCSNKTTTNTTNQTVTCTTPSGGTCTSISAVYEGDGSQLGTDYANDVYFRVSGTESTQVYIVPKSSVSSARIIPPSRVA